jgi:hypothetical protein
VSIELIALLVLSRPVDMVQDGACLNRAAYASSVARLGSAAQARWVNTNKRVCDFQHDVMVCDIQQRDTLNLLILSRRVPVLSTMVQKSEEGGHPAAATAACPRVESQSR